MNDGKLFEGAVARWLAKSGAAKIERRVRVAGDVAQHGHEVDVRAFLVNPLWKLFMIVGLIAIFMGAVSIAFDAEAFTILSGIIGSAFVSLAFAFRLDPHRVWIECKSGELTVRRDVVWKLAGQVEDVRRNALTKGTWFPSEAWIVARSRFDVDALQFAKKNKIRCFLEQSGDIREVL
jgi:hypothetical protein